MRLQLIPASTSRDRAAVVRRVVISDETALEQWHRSSRHPLALAIGLLTPEENWRWAREINRHVKDCGCSFGALAAVVALVAYPTLLLLGSLHQPDRWGLEFLLWLPLIFVSGGAGKVIGLLRARWRLKWTLRRLGSSLRERREWTQVLRHPI
jgi:hypothetical protein